MAIDPTPPSNLVDLSGLPEPVVQEVRKLVQQARAKQAEEARSAGRTSGENGPPPNGHPMGKSMANPKESPDPHGPQTPAAPFPRFLIDPRPTAEESRRLLDQMASMSSGHVLPADFSRADVYDDHD